MRAKILLFLFKTKHMTFDVRVCVCWLKIIGAKIKSTQTHTIVCWPRIVVSFKNEVVIYGMKGVESFVFKLNIIL